LVHHLIQEGGAWVDFEGGLETKREKEKGENAWKEED
jgi:hypothetical protein